jgi:hypothetical protein
MEELQERIEQLQGEGELSAEPQGEPQEQELAEDQKKKSRERGDC